MITMVDELLKTRKADLRLGVVEYRDHPPQDRSFVFRSYPFTSNWKEAQKAINKLEANGGGDGPEAVLDGVLAACNELQWRAFARRLIVLVGDASPHGAGDRGDGFPKGCPCGETIESVTAAAEEARITLYAIGMYPTLEVSFGALSRATGGQFFVAGQQNEAITRLQAILINEFGSLDFDERVLAAWQQQQTHSIEALVDTLASSRPAVSASISRLGARGLLA
ncbi:MAG: hypothetical protein JOZ18_19045 [Chloroflexi bacterium]|nr:hypothetical protein [Chloroflexota bacterium]